MQKNLNPKIGYDTYTAIQLIKSQMTEFKAYCFYCLLTAFATFASIPLVIPEAIAAVRAIIKKFS